MALDERSRSATMQTEPSGVGRLACRGMMPVVWVALALVACGREATLDDCQRIVQRITELELKGVVPDQQLSSEISEAQEKFRQRALLECEGRRITEKSLACVERATSASAIIDECFD